MSKNENLERAIVELLAIVYGAVPWGKMRTAHNVHDIFNHRVRAASRRKGINQFVSKLCNYFGLQSLPDSSLKWIKELRDDEDRALEKIYEEHIPLCVMAISEARTRKRRKEEKNG